MLYYEQDEEPAFPLPEPPAFLELGWSDRRGRADFAVEVVWAG